MLRNALNGEINLYEAFRVIHHETYFLLLLGLSVFTTFDPPIGGLGSAGFPDS